MNFWEAQRKARSRTRLYIALFAILTLIAAGLAEVAVRAMAGPDYQPPAPIVAIAFALITFGVATSQYLMYMRYGGSYVAESVGGKLIDPNTTDFKEKQLLNIVSEVATASALPTPPVYVLDAEQINAFAAGLEKDKAAVAFTRGAINALNRDELQGVVAHEFGHIYNGDMKISLRLAAMVMGFFFVLYIGMRMMQVSAYSGGNSQRKGNVLALFALVFFAAGCLTWAFGSILRASVSRQREYLADASAVQFTRNPDGLLGALKKIARQMKNDMPTTGTAYAHLYFDNHIGFSSLFATHPPIKKRIAALQSREYFPEEDQ